MRIKKSLQIIAQIIGIYSLFIAVSVAADNGSALCDGLYAEKQITQKQIDRLLKANYPHHAINFCKANLDNLDLSNQDLSGFNFDSASLRHTDLSYSNLTESTFKSAVFIESNLLHAYARWSVFDHAIFLKSNLENINLSDSSLKNITMKQVTLENAVASHSDFSNATIQLSNLKQANFSHAIFANSDLRINTALLSHFSYANLKNADLTELDAAQIKFDNADLTGVSFYQAHLKSADFTNAILNNTDFMYADLHKIIYRPNLVGLPLISSLTTVKNFETIQFYDDTLKGLPLTALKSAYKTNGMRSMERLITSMVKTQEMRHNLASNGTQKIGALFSYVLFYLTVDYGLSPSRPLILFCILILLMSIPYRLAINNRSSHYKILIEWKQWQINKAITVELAKLNYFRVWKNRLHYELVQWQRALYFSLLCAFRIGWDDFNISVWIQQMQRKDYKLTGKGRVRTIAGLHALISIYLILLWILTYFGRPFEW